MLAAETESRLGSRPESRPSSLNECQEQDRSESELVETLDIDYVSSSRVVSNPVRASADQTITLTNEKNQVFTDQEQAIVQVPAAVASTDELPVSNSATCKHKNDAQLVASQPQSSSMTDLRNLPSQILGANQSVASKSPPGELVEASTNKAHHHGSSSIINQLPSKQAQPANKNRFRFALKYVGCGMLHKNFTLPMLEWIAKDIRRHMLRVASQRQSSSTLSSSSSMATQRDIILEIQPFKLIGISSRNGHMVFVHPTHHVSKYVQLQQLEQTCFGYIIRDSKDSPQYCHLFQAKSSSKIHEIFNSIRQATTTALQHQPPQVGLGASGSSKSSSSSPPWIQKSATADCHELTLAALRIEESSSFSGSSNLASSLSSTGIPKTVVKHTMQPPEAPTSTSAADDEAQFENSYQFEVMFVKKVKLQCRRVPASFVDDALETLKSFDVLKVTEAQQVKSRIGKRIINARVDEQQEYDDVDEQTGANTKSQPERPPSRESRSCQSSPKKVPQVGGTGDCGTVDEQSRMPSMIQITSTSPPTSTTSSGSSTSSGISSSASLCPTHNPSAASSNCSDDMISVLSWQDPQAQAQNHDQNQIKKHQSVDCLPSECHSNNLEVSQPDKQTKGSSANKQAQYSNDFSPYSTITSSHLKERIAANPLVSCSVSLDHETRQRLARQVRETIMAKAANIKKDVYETSGDKLKSNDLASIKAIDSLSCTLSSKVPSIDQSDEQGQQSGDTWSILSDASGQIVGQPEQHQTSNFDMFRRASARQVVRNRTMLLLIGKDELCTISTDKHQVLFNKSFSTIVHCLQGVNNRDHFGLICRDSSKVNPQLESHAGFIFKCQSERVVRDIMAALRQGIYSSQLNYNQSWAFNYDKSLVPKTTTTITTTSPNSQLVHAKTSGSIDYKRAQFESGHQDPLHRQGSGSSSSSSSTTSSSLAGLTPVLRKSAELSSTSSLNSLAEQQDQQQQQFKVMAQQNKNQSKKSTGSHSTVKTMFCDSCPMYWFHRLCCDIESLPAEASKTIILRRIDSSLSDKEQDDLYSKFSRDYEIDSLDEHNEVFMLLLRLLCESKQAKHSATQPHLDSMAKQLGKTSPGDEHGQKFANKTAKTTTTASSPQSPSSGSSLGRQLSLQLQMPDWLPVASSTLSPRQAMGHQRSGSTSAALGGSSTFTDASSLAMDNLKRAKNTISTSIESMFKRRYSMKDEDEQQVSDELASGGPVRTGSFKVSKSGSHRGAEVGHLGDPRADTSDLSMIQTQSALPSSSLKRSQSSTSDCSSKLSFWSSSFSRTINDDIANPFAGLFRRRSSTMGQGQSQARSSDDGNDGCVEDNHDSNRLNNKTVLVGSSECLSPAETGAVRKHNAYPRQPPSSPSLDGHGQSQSSSVLSSSFWKKSIFDKIRQPDPNQRTSATSPQPQVFLDPSSQQQQPTIGVAREATPRSREHLRALWKRAILEQITLIKMDRQNQQTLQASERTKRASTVTQPIKSPSPIPASIAQRCEPTKGSERIKLNYRDIPYGREAPSLWDRMLRQDPSKKIEFVDVARLVRLGLPKQRRGEVWMFLMNQYQLRHGTSYQPADSEFNGDANQSFRKLLSQLSIQQHEIFVDIGRTFPTHPYYSQYLSIGQLSLFNLLKGYSLLDPQVGYCQGLSFVAGTLLLHVDTEDEAFELMRHLLFNFGLRKQYLPSMTALHLQLYQITRLLRDHDYELFNHFDCHDISPGLYAAPWFMTLFASQFPLNFVARLMDLVFLIGIEAIFRVSLNLLAYHRTALLACNGMEATMEFLRSQFVKTDDKSMAKIFDKSFSLDLRNQLIEYEIEYTFYCAEDRFKSVTEELTAHQTSSNENRRDHDVTRCYQSKFDRENLAPVSADDDLPPDEGDSNGPGSSGPSYENRPSCKPLRDGESTSRMADATATLIIQHLLSNNHLKSLRSNYGC